jgi:DNA polymerase III subunit delta
LTEVKPHQFEAALRTSLPALHVILVHGPDTGHVAERASQAARASGIALDDAFSCIRADADDFLSEPGRLLDEARSISMFGGKRLIWLRLGSRNAVNAVEAVLAEPVAEALILLEAGELRAGHALRSLCEGARNALTVACYPDEGETLQAVVTSMIRSAGKSITPDALAALTESLGADRALTRNEIEKLLLYMGEANEIGTGDVAASIADAASAEPSEAVDLSFAGQLEDIEPTTRRVIDFGTESSVLLGMAFRHAQTLISMLQLRRDGMPAKDAMRRSGVHFKREAMILRQLALWDENRLLQAAATLGRSIADCRKAGPLSPLIAVRAFWSVALAARRQQPQR